MHRAIKSAFLGIISFLVVIGFTIPATTYAYGYNPYGAAGDFFFPAASNSAYSQPRERLIVYAFGPTSAPSYNTNQIGTYQPAYNAGGSQYPAQYAYQQPQNSYPLQNQTPHTFMSGKFQNYTYIAPQTMQYGSIPDMGFSSYLPAQAGGNPYMQPQNYSYQTPQYSYPQNNYSYQPSYGYGGGYAQPTGNVDFFGNQLCNWGYDYQGYPCDRDPHQWIHDPYTGAWY